MSYIRKKKTSRSSVCFRESKRFMLQIFVRKSKVSSYKFGTKCLLVTFVHYIMKFNLRWLKTVSSTFQDVGFDGS